MVECNCEAEDQVICRCPQASSNSPEKLKKWNSLNSDWLSIYGKNSIYNCYTGTQLHANVGWMNIVEHPDAYHF